MYMRTVFGIDVSKATSNVAVLIDSKKIKEFKINNDLIGFGQLAADLNDFTEPEVIFEATGVYSRRLSHFLQINSFPYVQLNPLQASKEMDSLRKNKTDKNDAFHLAETQFKLNRQKTLLQNPIYSELMDAHRFYQEEIHDFVTEKDRLHRTLQLTFPELEEVMSAPTGILYWNLVTEFPIPSEVQKYNIDQLSSIILECSENKSGINKAHEIALKLAKLSKVAVSSVGPKSITIKQVKHQASELKRIDKMKKKIIRSMQVLAEKLSEFKNLCSIPGISTITAVSLIAELGDVRRFKTTNQLNAFVGIDLRHYASGNYVAADRISKRGNPYARKILYNTVIDMISVSRYSPSHINDYYQNKKQSSQNSSKKIAIASMSRLLRTIYHLVVQNKTYDYKIASHTMD